jgi:ribose/xylose/arabinose/galactoside ABC-type transport system permease subunit
VKGFLRKKEFAIGLILVILAAALTIASPVFFTASNFLDILSGNAVLGILAIGMTLIIITGGIDVSVASYTACVTVIIGKLAQVLPSQGWGFLLLFIAAPVSGMVLGWFNGILISKTKIPPIVTTLGTMSIVAGATQYITNGSYMNSTIFPQGFIHFADSKPLGIPVSVYFLAGTSLLAWYILKHTWIGRSIVAIGGNETSSVRVGINLKSVQLFVYTFMGFLTGIAGIVQTAYTKGVDPNGLTGFELTVIAAVVLGGASITGGTGSILGTILGVLLLGVMQNGLILVHVDTFWQDIIVGAIILMAVSYDSIKRRLEEKNLTKVEVEM